MPLQYILRAPSIPPTPACALGLPPDHVIVLSDTDWDVAGGYICPQETEFKYSLAVAGASITEARRGGAVIADMAEALVLVALFRG